MAVVTDSGQFFSPIKSVARLDWIRFRIFFFTFFFKPIKKLIKFNQSIFDSLSVGNAVPCAIRFINMFRSRYLLQLIQRTRTCWHTSEKRTQQKKRTKAEPRNYDRRLRVLNAVRNIIHYFTFMGTCEHACMRFRTQ